MTNPASTIQSQESRGKKRHALAQTIQVSDSFSSQELGSLVNITLDGMMLVSARPIETNRIYQITLELPELDGSTHSAELVIDCLWSKRSGTEEVYWAGCAIIDADDAAMAVIQLLIENYCE